MGACPCRSCGIRHIHPTISIQVIATHPYHGEDEDELSFEKGDTISVVRYEDADDEVSYPSVPNLM